MESVTLGLSITGVAGLALSLTYYLIRKGMKSKCIVAGKTITLDIHDTTKNEMSPKHNEAVVDKPVRVEDEEVKSGL